jgi:hypothetical protein
MNNDLTNILPDGHQSDADRSKRLQRLNDELYLTDDEPLGEDDMFELEATQGLQHIDKTKIPFIVDKLNADLQRQLKKKKKRRGIFKDPSSIYITIITILLLIIISFIIIKKLSQ